MIRRLGPSTRASILASALGACLLAAGPVRNSPAEGLAAAPARAPGPRDAPRWYAAADLRAEALALRLGAGRGDSCLGLGLEADGDGAVFEACLRASGGPDGDFGLAAGPGSASGSLRFLVDPCSAAALSPGPLLELDRSLASRCGVLGLRAGGLSLFALARESGPLAFAARPESAAGLPEASAGGASLAFERGNLRLEALAAASRVEARPEPSGWIPDPYSSSALGACEGEPLLAEGALILRGRRERGESLAAAAASYGRLSGTALALRLESREAEGPLELRLRAAASSPAFRALFGEAERRLFGASAEARLALRRASALSAALGAEAEGRGRRLAPLWSRSAKAKLVSPLGSEPGRVFEAALEARRGPAGEGTMSMAAAIRRSRDSSSARLGVSLGWDGASVRLALELSSRAAWMGSLPELGLDLRVERSEGGASPGAAVAKGGFSLALPWGEGGSLELSAELPGGGLPLEPLPDGSSPPGLELGLRYRASFGASTRSRRSRRSTGPKASSIAQRAAS
jgi:hypothetical protein